MNVAKYKISADEDSRFLIRFGSSVENIVGLRMAPQEIEPVLLTGRWLVLVFAIWDIKDRPPIDIACEIAADASNFQVAVRPFQRAAEFASWVPGFSSNAGAIVYTENNGSIAITTRKDDHPMWFVMGDGQFTATLVGAREKPDVDRFVRENLS